MWCSWLVLHICRRDPRSAVDGHHGLWLLSTPKQKWRHHRRRTMKWELMTTRSWITFWERHHHSSFWPWHHRVRWHHRSRFWLRHHRARWHHRNRLQLSSRRHHRIRIPMWPWCNLGSRIAHEIFLSSMKDGAEEDGRQTDLRHSNSVCDILCYVQWTVYSMWFYLHATQTVYFMSSMDCLFYVISFAYTSDCLFYVIYGLFILC